MEKERQPLWGEYFFMNFDIQYTHFGSKFEGIIPFIQICRAQGTLSWLTKSVLSK